MKITIKLSETNNALLNRVVKEEKVDASEFANSAFLDKFLPVSEKLGIEAGFILQEHEAGTLDAWLVKQCISRGIRWLGNHPIRDCAILKQILVRFPFSAKDNGKISTCNECVQSDMDSVVALLKERVPGYAPLRTNTTGWWKMFLQIGSTSGTKPSYTMCWPRLYTPTSRRKTLTGMTA